MYARCSMEVCSILLCFKCYKPKGRPEYCNIVVFVEYNDLLYCSYFQCNTVYLDILFVISKISGSGLKVLRVWSHFTFSCEKLISLYIFLCVFGCHSIWSCQYRLVLSCDVSRDVRPTESKHVETLGSVRIMSLVT